jgi:hypothetical protein
MTQDLLYRIFSFAGAIPYFAILGILVHYVVRRAVYKYKVRRRALPGFCPSSAALATAFLLGSMLFRPRLQYAIEAQLVVESENDDDGGPDSPGKLDKQLKRIRRGEPIENLTLRL